MTDKQREDHVQAKYWNGYVTRVEAQKQFDQYATVLNQQGVALQKMDAVLSFMAQKFGVTTEEISAWVEKQVEEASKNSLEKAVDAAEPKLVTEN